MAREETVINDQGTGRMRRRVSGIVKSETPLVCLTAYTTPMARRLDPYVDILLVGDSLGMVLYGFKNTLPVTLEMMIAHGAAVMRGVTQALVVVDMPYGTYEQSKDQALSNAKRVIEETGCDAVKLEGGETMAETVRHLVDHNIPVMGHIGLMPQSVEKIGGFVIQGRDEREAGTVQKDARAIEAAGAFAIVIEGTVEPLARAITAMLKVPTIGIGASAACDGQILVIDDMLGTFDGFKPRFVKRYADLGAHISEAAESYANDVRARRFPGAEHVFQLKSVK
jgi:3-methyl-2-oxobutanoate hydroxymethyltransferase